MLDVEKIATKRHQFIAEIGDAELNTEQRRIYNAFVSTTCRPYNFAVMDRYGNTIRFVLYTNKISDGSLHILRKHYKGTVGRVSAMEIVNLCDVIRKGELSMSNGNLKYTLKRRGRTYTLIVYLKRTSTGKNVLKSFYSNIK